MREGRMDVKRTLGKLTGVLRRRTGRRRSGWRASNRCGTTAPHTPLELLVEVIVRLLL